MQTIIISRGTAAEREEAVSKIIFGVLGKAGSHPDFHIIEADEDKKLISIDKVRELIKFVHLRPVSGSSKIMLIRDAQRLSIEAQNALLRVIEEPPKYAQIIFTADHHNNLINTVVSRCRVFELFFNGLLNTDSDSYVKAIDEFVALLRLSIGARIDWVSSQKVLLKNRRKVVEMLNSWELLLRDVLVASTGADVYKVVINQKHRDLIISFSEMHSSKVWMESLNYLRYVVKSIGINNANIPLGVESFLVNLPESS